LSLLFAVIKHSIIKRSDNIHCLVIVNTEEFWLFRESNIELHNIEYLSLLSVQNDDRILLGKDDLCWLFVTFSVFEVESHRNFVQFLEL
jgi:hypothetical protein